MKHRILLLGGSGYVGSAFARQLDRQGIPFRTFSRADINYYERVALRAALQDFGATFLINAAGYTGKPNVDACELHKADCLLGNAVLPGIIRDVCEQVGIPWGHVSSGCIYTGRRADGAGFTESDPPNFSFRTDNCSFYSGTKALGEETLTDAGQCYIWRLRIPFDHHDGPRNYLSKLLNYDTLLDAENSISHLGDFVQACLDCIRNDVPFGIYNVTNTGSVTTRQLVDMIQKSLTPDRHFRFFTDEDEFMRRAAKTPRSNCVMDNSKLRAAGVAIRPVEEAVQQSLQNWISRL